MRCSANQMYVGNNLLNFAALLRIKTNPFSSRLTVSDNAIIKVLLDIRVAREKIWNYWYSIVLSTVVSLYLVLYMSCEFICFFRVYHSIYFTS